MHHWQVSGSRGLERVLARCTEDFQSCQVSQENVHGGVEGMTDLNSKGNERISTQAGQVHRQEGHENHRLDLRVG